MPPRPGTAQRPPCPPASSPRSVGPGSRPRVSPPCSPGHWAGLWGLNPALRRVSSAGRRVRRRRRAQGEARAPALAGVVPASGPHAPQRRDRVVSCVGPLSNRLLGHCPTRRRCTHAPACARPAPPGRHCLGRAARGTEDPQDPGRQTRGLVCACNGGSGSAQ